MQLVYFAWVRTRIGKDAETLAVPAGMMTVSELLDWLAVRSPGHAAALEDRSAIKVAVDQQFAGPDTSIAGASEIAIFPPVTGG
ncbi:molybdopterin converting factor subunit 1 [Sandarakinorhabdus sp.]|uniref:molybdopterin converting factor subunit 1 n=1 Tax=Sandarakinorhabdus sp. TaxID=1916663 RepID=UPI00286E2650|nr:molybdopterin converting factor subunit 1 [Sandarakinorhabdus sp.]